MGEFICGFELHVPLACKTKIFCSCPIASKDAEPNTFTCPICLGMPGAKPVLNKKAVDHAIKLSVALACQVERELVFSRKTYFYPDLAKNFQISQFEVPVGKNGFVMLDSGKKVRIRRVHLEEDPGALVHESGVQTSNYVLVDYNRSGVPLCEIVTEPDITFKEEAKEFLGKLNSIVSYLEIFDIDNAVIKADTNISIKGGERVEVKNVTGAKNVELAINYELKRQEGLLINKGKIERETRGFDETSGETYLLRKKETEEDYGFIVDADLVPTIIDDKWLVEIKSSVPEFAAQKAKRFVKQYGLKEYDAKVIASDKNASKLFESAAEIDVKIAGGIISGALFGVLNYNKLSLSDTKITEKGVSDLVSLIKSGKVSEKNAKESLIKYALEGTLPKDFLEKNRLLIDTNSSDVEAAVREIVAQNAEAFDDFKSGNTKSLNFIIGLVMKKLKGKADARTVQKIIESMK